MRVRRAVVILAGLPIAVVLATRAGAADLHFSEPALRAGASFQPDQLHAGLQALLGPGQRVRFRPSLDVGIGNGVRIASLNADIVVPLARAHERFRPYLGAGPGLTLVDVTSGVGEAQGGEVSLVGHAIAGLVLARPVGGAKRLGLELRGGLGNTPDFGVTMSVWF